MSNYSSKIRIVAKDIIQTLMDKNSSYTGVLNDLKVPTNMHFREILYDRIEKESISLKMFNSNKTRFHSTRSNRIIPIENLLIENCRTNHRNFKKRLIRENIIMNVCDICKMKPEWNGKVLTLQLDHINGTNNDNRLENLRLLCPNCHSQTSTFCGKNTNKTKKIKKCRNCDTAISKDAILCRKCSLREPTQKVMPKKFEISTEDLFDLVHNQKKTYVEIGKMFGVSDNAIRKRCKKLGVYQKRKQ